MFIVEYGMLESNDTKLINYLYNQDYYILNYDFCEDASSNNLIYLRELDKVVYILDLSEDLVTPAKSCSENFRKFNPVTKGVRKSKKLDYIITGLSKLINNYRHPKANNPERIIKRDGGICQLCISRDDLEVHHIIPKSNQISLGEWINNSFNVVTLCGECHHKVHEINKVGFDNEKMDYLDKLLKFAGNNYTDMEFLNFCTVLGLYPPITDLW
jgi:5-methylcytosine-specific restriction endonuclease McrA